MTPLEGALVGTVGLAVLAPLVGLTALRLLGERVRPRAVVVTAAAVSFAAAAGLAGLWQARDGQAISLGPRMAGGPLLLIDGLTALLLPYATLVDLAIVVAAPSRALVASRMRRMLPAAAGTFAAIGTAHPLALVLLWIATVRLTWRAVRGAPGCLATARLFGRVMTASAIALTIGTALIVADPPWSVGSGWIGATGGWLVAGAVMLRKGIVPFHSWYPAFFADVPLGTVLAFTMPQGGTYTAVRLLVGHADGVALELVVISHAALLTAAYGAALAMIQRDVRGLLGMLAMSQTAMVLAGLSGAVPMELCGALAVWISSGLSLTGAGLVIWSLESRGGPIPLDTLQGRFADAPALATFLLLFGLAAIGFPGTLSFVADDLIVSGSLDDQLSTGLLVIGATACCGIAIVRGWFLVFGGPVMPDAPRHVILPREQATLSVLLALLLALGMVPGPLVRSLESVAESLLASRNAIRRVPPSPDTADDARRMPPPGARTEPEPLPTKGSAR
jgi:NADH-quinone oxidoreductase subunit M